MRREKKISIAMQDCKKNSCLRRTTPIALLLLTFTAGCHRDPNVWKHKYFESGLRYEKEGKLREATIQFSNALKIDGSYSAAHYELSKAYVRLGNVMAGYTELMRTVDLAPSNVQARLDLGTMLLAGGVADRAEEQAKAALKLEPNNADAFALMASIAEKRGDHDAALTNLQHALTIAPNRAAFHTALALIQNLNPQNAVIVEQELKRAISLDSKSATAHLILAGLLEQKGDRPGAEQEDLQAIQSDSNNLNAHVSLAGLYLRMGDKARAEQVLRRATEIFSDANPGAALLKDYYVQTGQLDRAEIAYADLMAKYPKSIPIKLSYANILARRQEFAKLKPLAAELTKSDGANAQVQILNSTLLLQDGKTNDAFSLLQKAVRDSPQDVELQIALAKVAEAKGDATVAQTSYQQAAQLSPHNVDAQLGLAQMANQRKDWTLLAQIADKTIALSPDFADAYLWRGTAEMNLKQYEKAEEDLQSVLKKNPDDVSALIGLGQLAYRQQRFPKGSAMLELALQRNPNAVLALNLLVQNDLDMKHPEKAVARFQQQIEKSPQNATYYLELSILQQNMKDLVGAQNSAKKAMQIDPTNQHAVQAYAQASASLGNTDEAVRTWEHWVSNHPTDTVGFFALALLEDMKGNQGKAIEYYKKTLQIDPAQPLASNNLAYLMVEAGQNIDVALSLAEAARRSLPDSPNTADTLAWVYYHKGTYSLARDLLEGALKVSPDNASMHYHLGMTYTKLGDKSGALLHLKKAAALDPNTQTGKAATAAMAQTE